MTPAKVMNNHLSTQPHILFSSLLIQQQTMPALFRGSLTSSPDGQRFYSKEELFALTAF